jgi:hypothetical protein
MPLDVLTGFLPPEDGSGRGQGHFSYVVRPDAGIASGTEIRNVAEIRFDFAEAITTNQVDPHDPSLGTDPAKEALITIDSASPASAVQSLPTFSRPEFTVNWSGGDDAGGSGIAYYDVYASENGEPFVLWRDDATATSGTFVGTPGQRYAFYSVATDNVGHRQDVPLAAQASTTILIDVISGTAGDDNIHVVRAGGELAVYLNIAPSGEPTYRVPLDQIATLTILAGDGNDTLTVHSGQQTTLGLERLIYNAGAGTNALVLANGSARIESAAPAGMLNTSVQGGAHMTTSRLNQDALSLATASRVTLLSGGETSLIRSLSLAAGATLDIGDNALVLDYAGDSPLADVRQTILTGRGGAGFGAGWNGMGITSSAAAAANQIEPESRSVGFAENALLPLGAYTTFRGVAVDDTSILIAYARTADANLNGTVDDDDVTVVGATYAPSAANFNWSGGDFDFNGFVDDDDVTLLGALYNPVVPAVRPAPLKEAIDLLAESIVAAGDAPSVRLPGGGDKRRACLWFPLLDKLATASSEQPAVALKSQAVKQN